MDFLSRLPSLLNSSFNYAVIPVLLVQGALLHPYYEPLPNFRALRMFLAPVIIGLVVSSQPKRIFKPLEDWLHLNYAWVAIPTFHITCIALQYAFHRGPARKADVHKYKSIQDASGSSDSESDVSSSSITNSDSQGVSSYPEPIKVIEKASQGLKRRIDNNPRVDMQNLEKHHPKKLSRCAKPCIAELFKFSLWMTCSPRSLEYTWGPPESILTFAPKKSVTWFTIEETLKLVINQIAIIAMCSVELPASVHPRGYRGWLIESVGLNLPDHELLNLLIESIFVSTWSAIGFHVFVVIGCLFNLMEIVVITLSNLILPKPWKAEKLDPTLYPEMFNYPPFRTSLTDFWAKGWHCVFRRDFVFCGAEPMVKLTAPLGPTAQKIAGVMGAMFISGVMHEWGFSSSVGEIDWKFRTGRFFVMGGIGMVLESVFKKFTGRKVGGFFGWIWLWAWMGFWSANLMEAWLSKGVGIAGMRGDLEIKNWKLARFLIPVGPLMPDELIDKFSLT